MSIYIPSNNNGVTVSQLLAYNYVDRNTLNTNLATKPNFSGNTSFQSSTGTFSSLNCGTGTFSSLSCTTGTFNALSTDALINFRNANSVVSIGVPSLPVSGNGANSVCIGAGAGYVNQQSNCVAVGFNSGSVSQQANSVAIGTNAGGTQGSSSIAIGLNAGFNQGDFCIGIGRGAGYLNQSTGSTAIGSQAGNTNLGSYSTCIGYQAGYVSTPANTIVINSGSTALSPSTSGLFINNITGRAAGKGVNVLCYDTSTKEVYYSTT